MKHLNSDDKWIIIEFSVTLPLEYSSYVHIEAGILKMNK